VEYVGFIRHIVWQNAGFGALRRIWMHISDAEPRFVPTIYPSDVVSLDTATAAPIGSEVDEKDVPALANSAVAQYRKAYLFGDITPLAIVEALFSLIRRGSVHSPAWVDIKVNLVLKAAEASTFRYQRQRSLGPLDGIPVEIKDQYDVDGDVDGYSTKLGSTYDLTGRDQDGNTYNSWCVQKLQEAGAIVVGKLNMHEFGMDTSGINTTYGTPRNPYNRNSYTGGSSSGPAYAVATGLVLIALGTDGGGSTRIPASFCSVFGLKPSHGRLSYLPGHYHNNTCEVDGPIASDMGSSQPSTPSSSNDHIPPHLFHRRRGAARQPQAWFDRTDPGVQDLCRSLIDALVQTKGYTTVPITIPLLPEGQAAHAISTLSGTSVALPPDPRIVSPANRILLALGRATSAGDYVLAQQLRGVLMRHLAWLWREQYPSQDLLIVTPTTACAGWPIRSPRELERGLSDGNQTLQSMEYVWLANFCGMPSLSVPAGYVIPEGEAGAGRAVKLEPGDEKEAGAVVPVGLMATAEWTREDLLMRFGCDAEEVAQERLRRPAAWVDIIQQAAQLKGTRRERES
ncbi:hypothetical protein PG994_009106, partial [Apiospora phragmitis]